MISAEEARKLNGKLSQNIIDIINSDIKNACCNQKNSVIIDYLQDSNIDKQSNLIEKYLINYGYEIEFKINKFFWIDYGFRTLKISW